MNGEQKFVSDTIKEYTSEWDTGTIKGEFESEKFTGEPLIDTSVTLTINKFTIAWNDRHKLINELAMVLKKYQI